MFLCFLLPVFCLIIIILFIYNIWINRPVYGKSGKRLYGAARKAYLNGKGKNVH